jgi:hypothetical protein
MHCGPARGAIALCAGRRYIRFHHDHCAGCSGPARPENTMRAEIERLVEEIKQSVGLLRRHL